MQEIQHVGLPVRAALHPTGLYLALRNIVAAELQDAFMQETVARLAAPETIAHIATADVGKAAPETAPIGLIFHVARCGSTLISQSLKKLDNLVVYAEPQPVNEILAPPHKWPRGGRIAALRSLGAAFARHAGKPYVLKFSSWNTLYCDLLAEAFPASPWVLSLRDPIEVGVSLLTHEPGWLRATSEASRELAKAIYPGGACVSREEFAARVYGAFCEAASRLVPGRGKLVSYDTLPAAVWEIVAPHFSLSIDARQRDAIAQSARSHAKAPIGKATAFAPDAATKQAAASPELRRAIDTFARPHLERLKKRHRS
jgi:hypothetical protein